MQCHMVPGRIPGTGFGAPAMQPFQNVPSAAWPNSYDGQGHDWARSNGQQTAIATQATTNVQSYQNRLMAKTSTLGLSSLTSPLNTEPPSTPSGSPLYRTRASPYPTQLCAPLNVTMTSPDKLAHYNQVMPQRVSRFPGNRVSYTNIHHQAVPHECSMKSHSFPSPLANASKRQMSNDLGRGYCPPKKCYSVTEVAPAKSFLESAFSPPKPESPVSDEDALRRYLGTQAVNEPPPLVKTTSPDNRTMSRYRREDLSQSQSYRIPPPLVSRASQHRPHQLISVSTTYDNVREAVSVTQGSHRRYSTSAISQPQHAMHSAQTLRRAASYGCEGPHVYEKRNKQNSKHEYESAFHFAEGYTGSEHKHNLHLQNITQPQQVTQDIRSSFGQVPLRHETNGTKMPTIFTSSHQMPTVFTSSHQMPTVFASSHQMPTVFTGSHQSRIYEGHHNLQRRQRTQSKESYLVSQGHGNVQNHSSLSHEGYQIPSGLREFPAGERQRNQEDHQATNASFQNYEMLQNRGVYQVQQSHDRVIRQNQSQDGSTSHSKSSVLLSKVSRSNVPPPLRRMTESAIVTAGANDQPSPNPERSPNVRSPTINPTRPRPSSVGSKPPPLRHITEQERENSTTNPHAQATKKISKENSSPRPAPAVSEDPTKGKADRELPEKCGGYAYDHKSLPKIVAVHSFVSGDENVLKLIGQPDAAVRTSVTVSVAGNGKSYAPVERTHTGTETVISVPRAHSNTSLVHSEQVYTSGSCAGKTNSVTTGVQTHSAQGKHSQAVLAKDRSDTDNDDDVVLTKITRNGVKVEINESQPVIRRKAAMIDSMCQTTCTSVSAAMESYYENIHDVTTSNTFNYPSPVRDTTNSVADKSCQSLPVVSSSPSLLSPSTAVAPNAVTTTSQIETSCNTENLSNSLSTNSKTDDFSSSSLGITINNVTSLQEPKVSCADKSSECSGNSQPTKVDSCVQVTSARTVTTKSVAANTILVHAGTYFAVTQDAQTRAHMQLDHDFTQAATLPSSPPYPEQQQSMPNSSQGTKWKRELQIDTTNPHESENVGVEPNRSPKLLKKRRPSTEELCKKITNTRERMRNEQIPWKRKVLLRLQMVLVKRLRKSELETGDRATVDINEIEAECLENLRHKPAHQYNGTTKTGSKISKEGTEHHPQRKANKQTKKPREQVETAKTKLNKRKYIEEMLKETCVQHDSLERESKLQVESAALNEISSIEPNAATTESSFSQLESKHKGCVALNSAWGVELDQKKVKVSSTHSEIKKSKSYPIKNSNSPVYRSQGKQFNRQVSCPDSKISKYKTSESINERRLSGDTSKAKSIFAATSSFLSFKKTATSKHSNSTTVNNNIAVKSGSLEYHAPNAAVTKQHNKTPGLQKRPTSSNELSSLTTPDLQRDNAKKISSWGGAIKPQSAEVNLHNSLPGGSHSAAKYDKMGVKRHWLMCATDS